MKTTYKQTHKHANARHRSFIKLLSTVSLIERWEQKKVRSESKRSYSHHLVFTTFLLIADKHQRHQDQAHPLSKNTPQVKCRLVLPKLESPSLPRYGRFLEPRLDDHGMSATWHAVALPQSSLLNSINALFKKLETDLFSG